MTIKKANPILSNPYSRTQPRIQGAAPLMDKAHPSQNPQVTPSQASRPLHLSSGNNNQASRFPKLGS